MLEKLTVDDFVPHVGTEFQMIIDDRTSCAATLHAAEASRYGNASNDARRAPFSLVFVTRADFLVEQRIYLLRHPVMGEMSLFLVPIGPIREGMRYEAVFA